MTKRRRRRWKRVRVQGNDERPLFLYRLGNHIVCLNINRGRDGWWYEVTEVINGHGEEKTIGEAPTLEAAKEMVETR